MSNRIASMVTKVQASLAEQDPEVVAKTDADLALDFEEHFIFQQQQSQAFAAGIINQAEATICYNALGEVGSSANGGWADGTDTATKFVVSKMVSELLGRKVA